MLWCSKALSGGFLLLHNAFMTQFRPRQLFTGSPRRDVPASLKK